MSPTLSLLMLASFADVNLLWSVSKPGTARPAYAALVPTRCCLLRCCAGYVARSKRWSEGMECSGPEVTSGTTESSVPTLVLRRGPFGTGGARAMRRFMGWQDDLAAVSAAVGTH